MLRYVIAFIGYCYGGIMLNSQKNQNAAKNQSGNTSSNRVDTPFDLMSSFREYHFNATKLFKIWFSAKPEVFMPFLNQQRLKACRKANPKATISLIYSRRCLNQHAHQALLNFCSKHNINAVDFDKLLLEKFNEYASNSSDLTVQMDWAVMYIANQEIMHTLEKSGGNLAASSDALRLVKSVIEAYGVYSDLDAELYFDNIKWAAAHSPILLNGEDATNQTICCVKAQTNEILLFALDKKGHLHPDADVVLKKMQSLLIDNYSKPYSKLLDENIFSKDSWSQSIVKSFFNGLSSIFEYRLKVAEFKKPVDMLVLAFPEEAQYLRNCSEAKVIPYAFKFFQSYLVRLSKDEVQILKNDPPRVFQHIMDTLNQDLIGFSLVYVTGPKLLSDATKALNLAVAKGRQHPSLLKNTVFKDYYLGSDLADFSGLAISGTLNPAEQIKLNRNDTSWCKLGETVLNENSKIAALKVIGGLLPYLRAKQKQWRTQSRVTPDYTETVAIPAPMTVVKPG